MKIINSLSIIAVVTSLYACTSNQKQTNSNDSLTTVKDFKQLDTAVTFAGYWISESFAQRLNSSKSPKLAQDSAMFIHIPNKTLQKTMMIHGFHEGGPILKVLKNNTGYELWEEQNDSLTQMRYKIQLISPTRIKLNGTSFVKTNILKKENEHKILEELLFKGQYTDATGTKIEFKNNGQLVGLPNYKYYEPILDYYDVGMDVDQIGMGTSKDKMEWFGFKFNKDTLEIYKLDCLASEESDKSCTEVGFGKLAYKLWRK